MYKINRKNVEPYVFDENEVEKVSAKYLITEEEGATKFNLRIFTIEPGGHSELEQHEYEHEVFVLEGRGRVKTEENSEEKKIEIGEGDAILVESNETHQFYNPYDEPLSFICVKGHPNLY